MGDWQSKPMLEQVHRMTLDVRAVDGQVITGRTVDDVYAVDQVFKDPSDARRYADALYTASDHAEGLA